MGGTRRQDTAAAANALLLHPNCHEWVERNRIAALELGFLVRQHETPTSVPVRLWNGWFILTEDGGKIAHVGQVDTALPLERGQEVPLLVTGSPIVEMPPTHP